MPEPLVSPDDVAEYLGVSRPTVYNLMARGLPSLKVGRCRRFRLADVDAWLDAQSEAA